MEIIPPEKSLSLPFALVEGEEVKLVQDAVKFSIKYNRFDEYELKEGTFVLTTGRVVFFTLTPEKKLVFFYYPNAVSFGISKLNLVVYLEENPGQEIRQEEDDDEEEEEEPDFIIEKLKSTAGFEEEDHVNLAGSYEATFDFSGTDLKNLENVLEVFNVCNSMNPDDDEEDINCGEEFITADDIDDAGNVIIKKKEAEDENDEEDDDEEDEEDEQGMKNETQTEKVSEESKMDEEKPQQDVKNDNKMTLE